MIIPRLLLLLLLLPLALTHSAARAEAAAATERIPVFRRDQVIVSYGEKEEWRYLAFPALLDLGDDVLISYKRARAHANDTGAGLEGVRIDGVTGEIREKQMLARVDDSIMQAGEWVRFPNGDIGNYIDVQQVIKRNIRTGTLGVRSTDGGHVFGPLERVGVVDGVEYGYPFEFITEGQDTWMLVMTFTALTGGKSIYFGRDTAGSVDVIHSKDNGRTWRFVRNLSKEFGNVPINESTFIRHGDGFLVSTRGYDSTERLHRTDANFKVLEQTNLTERYSFIRANLGRPRLFRRDGVVYLIGRNTTQAAPAKDADPSRPGRVPMQLCLFRLDPATLGVTSYSILDNAESANVTDGYYAVPYFRQVEGKTRLNVITYKGVDEQPPQIVRFEYLWDEVR